MFVLIAPLLMIGCTHRPETEILPSSTEEILPTQITLTAAQVAAIGIQTVEVALDTVGEPVMLPGRVMPEPDREAYVTSLIAGRIDAVFASLGDVVQAGQPVVRLTSPALGDLIAELKRTHTERERQVRLSERGVGIRKHLEEAQINYIAARQNLLSIGFDAEQLDALTTGEEISGLTLSAPISGYVLERNAVLGGPVVEGDRLFYLAALSPILVSAEAYERDLAGLQEGMDVTVMTPADPERRLEGRVADIIPRVDLERRTIAVRIWVPNQDGYLKPGMYATVLVPAYAGAGQHALPAETIRTDGGGAYVLVARNDTTFERVDVAAAVGAAGFVAVPELALGTRVVTRGGYQIVSAMQGVEVEDD